MNITEVDVGQTVTVTGYEKTEKAYRHKLLTMGLIRGAEFTLTRKAPLGDPVEIKLRGFNLTLRKAEAESMILELI
ncbi:MAG: ferrous iron transport protein A [Kiritimatiellae bacterium]|nr:ferrous iron transport protein A [Kiritimatiellia bacterium]